MNSFASKHVWEPSPSAYAVAVIGVGVAAGGRMLLNQITDPHIPLVTLHLVVLIAALCGGAGPALVSLIGGYLIAGLAFDAPRSAFGVFGMPDLWATTAYVVGGVAVAASGTTVRATRRHMREREQEANATRSELVRQLRDVEQQMAALKELPPGRLHVSAPPIAGARTPTRGDMPLATPASLLRRRIRVVDDERDSADSLALLLTMHGYEAEVSYDGLSALAAEAPDVLIVDIALPDINGYEIARRVRVDPRFARTFLIALSGFGTDEDRARAGSAGFDRCLTKPIDFVALRAVIDELR